MGLLHINGYAIPVEHGGELSYLETASTRAYSFNGMYQFSRNALARSWRFVTAPLSRDEVLSISQMVNMRGDAWRWALSSAPNGVHYIWWASNSEAFTDMRRPGKNSESKATVVSAYSADGGRVYDWNGNAYAPFSGCEGSVLVEPGTTNIVSQAIAECTDHTQFGSVGSSTKDNNADNFWQGSTSVSLITQAATPASGMKFTLTVAGGDYTAGDVLVWSLYVKGTAGGETIRLNVNEDTGSGYSYLTQTEYTINASSDAWTRIYLSISTTASTSVGIELNILNPATYAGGAQTFLIDGIQVEANPPDSYPTSWVSPGADPWLSGNGVRPAGILDYDTWLSSYTNGFTLSAWVNFQFMSPSASKRIFKSSTGNPNLYVAFLGTNVVQAVYTASDGSLLNAAAGPYTAGWHHIVTTYDPRDATARLYVDGALAISDDTWSGGRQRWDAESMSGDLSIGTAGVAGANTCPGPIGPVQVFPFAAPAKFIEGMYNSATDDVPVPGVMPLAVHGDILGAGEKRVYCYGEANSIAAIPHKPEATGVWEDGAGRVMLTLYEASGQ